jgi:hypothetical protein
MARNTIGHDLMARPSHGRGRGRGEIRDSPEKMKGQPPHPNCGHHDEGKAKVGDEVEVVRRASLLARVKKTLGSGKEQETPS